MAELGTHREVGEGDRATAGGETQTTSSSREVFLGRDRGDWKPDFVSGLCSEMEYLMASDQIRLGG